MVKLNVDWFQAGGPEDIPDAHLSKCSIFQGLPKSLQNVCQDNVHLMEYIHRVPVEELGIPEFYPELSRKLSELKKRNLIYPVAENVFTHICPDPHGERDFYISVEPSTTLELDALLIEVDSLLVDFADRFAEVENDEDRLRALMECLSIICGKSGGNGAKNNASKLGLLKRIRRNGNGGGARLNVTDRQYEGLRYLIERNKIGVGPLQPMMLDSNIEDISGSGLGHIFIEHKVFKSLKTGTYFETHEELDEFVLRLGERIKHPLTLRNPIADATLPDGSRVNIVYGRDVSKRGTSFSIRKFADNPLSVMELIGFHALSYQMAAYLSFVIEDGMNVFVCGETASGKTTLVNAITTFIHPQAKIITIEDTPELQIPHPNWLREVTKFTDDGKGVGMFDLLKAALRQRPDEILIGEIRGAEGNIAFQAMMTGHAVMSTFHAASVEKLIQRLVGEPINVPRNYIDNLNVVVIQQQVKTPDGKKGRRATSISEIIGFDPIAGAFNFVEVFKWNPVTDEFEFPGKFNSYLLEQKIAPKRGLPPDKARQIYAMVDRRGKVLEKLHKDKKISEFYEVLQVLAKAQREGIF